LNIEKLWIVEWSEQQRSFHVLQVEDAVQANLECFYHSRDPDESDWRMVGLVASHSQAHALAAFLQASLDSPPPAPPSSV
jgi:hypothetical protein